MLLKSIEISGFKSFAKKSILEFKTPVSGIVGPNGSGKSNVTEAFRFVLGEQSMKTLRGARSEDMIFNGAQGGARANRAHVKVTFDNTTRLLPIDTDEVTLERSVFRDGTHEYSINGSKVRLKDITELLSHAHIGASGHHMISQGEADAILNARPKDRKEIFEDALGLRAVMYRKIESEKKLAKTQDHMKEIDALKKELAPHLKYLKKQVEKAERAIALKASLESDYQLYLKRERLFLDAEKNAIKSVLQTSTDSRNAIRVQVEELSRLSNHRDPRKDFEADFVALSQEMSAIRTEKDSILREVGMLSGRLEVMATIEKKTEKGVRHISAHDALDWASKVKALTTNLDTITTDELKARLERVGALCRELEEIVNGKPDSETKAPDAGIEKVKHQISELETGLSLLSEKEKNIDIKRADINKRIEALEVEIRNSQTGLFEAKMKLSNEESRLAGLMREEEILKAREVRFIESVKEAGVLLGPSVLSYSNLDIAVNIDSADKQTFEREQEELRLRVERMKIRLEEAGGIQNDDVVKEYNTISERDAFLSRELADLEGAHKTLSGLVLELENTIKTQFAEGLQKINKEFAELFVAMFGGGKARLVVVELQKRSDEEVVEIEEGIEIEVELPRKKVKGLMMLSGGERSLVSIALLFAMSQVNPPPFIILDETDAALDEANSRRYGDMIEKLSLKSQLVIVTHNRETMSHAGIIYGVTMGADGVSKLLSIALEDAVSVAK